MAYLDENGEIVNGTGDSTQDARMLAPNAPNRTPALPGQAGPSQDLKSIGGITLHVPGAPVLFNSPINGAVYQTPTPDNGFSGYEGPRPSNPDGTTMGRNGTNPQDKPAASATDFTTPEGQLAWIKSQLAGTKYANDDPNYWLRRVNETGGFTDGNTSWWSDKIQSGYFGSPDQVAAEAANNRGSVDPLNPGQFSYQPFTDQFTNPNFVAPTGITEQNDPGYQERLRLGAQTLQASAAAKGTLLTGQTAKDLEDYAQNFASGEFGQVYNRALGEYNANSANNWQQYSQKYQQYLNGYQQALGQFNTNLGAGQQAFSDQFNLSSQNFNQNQQNWMNQYNLNQQGLGAAESAAQLGFNYSNQQGGYITGNGNAQAAGTVGAANATQYGLGALANYAQYLTPYMQNNGGGGGNFSGYYGSRPPSGSAFYSPQGGGGNNGQFWGY